METIAFLGCSRGLGYEVSKVFVESSPEARALLVARSEGPLQTLLKGHSEGSKVLSLDFSKPESLTPLLDGLAELRVKRLFYFAGGGPHGRFQDKHWRDHEWALQVSFLTPMRLLHELLCSDRFSHVEQIVFVGSAIADSHPDPLGASYASAKHGLKGLVTSVQEAGCSQDLRLFRPGYMDTGLIPNKAPIRTRGKLPDPRDVAKQFKAWVDDPLGPSILESEGR